MKLERSCGVVLHPTCLPGPYGIGDLGPAAHNYLDWLAGAGARWWQVLPLNPAGPGWSPYAATSTFAGNTALVSPELLLQDGLLEPSDLADMPQLSPFKVEFERVVPFKGTLLQRAFQRFSRKPPAKVESAFATFKEECVWWLSDYSAFAALKRAHHGASWHDWPEDLSLHRPGPLATWAGRHQRELLFEDFCQFLFFSQWRGLRAHARSLGVSILGDVPIYVAGDSAEVWANRGLFQLDPRGRPLVVGGVPPDYFSETGQLWGNPLYDWDALEATGFAWWIARLRATLELVDAVRLDHFRGFAAYWEVPAGQKTAIKGRWVPGPGRRLFDAARAALGHLPLVAEDLGVITEDVVALRDGLDLPGMAVLQFAFSPSPRSTFVPYQLRHNTVVYTGTHDNNTTLGWYVGDASEAEKDYVRRYVGTDGHEIHWDMIRLALSTVADLAAVPHQDIAGLGGDCRMNTPATAEGNWRFRLTDWMVSEALRDRFAELVWTYGRSGA
ncbi:MAG: 4-alpha-glucanotransferase [Acidobacteria bacterium RBG_13_68_16]|nr:MAG: 4-alpha-glucanotransferase [Acidobacteria bacterium RBG_13_68_16]